METTAFIAKVIDKHWPRGLDIPTEIIRRPTFAESGVKFEKGVVLKELVVDEENPDHLLGTIIVAIPWRHHGRGRPATGSQVSTRFFLCEGLREIFRSIPQTRAPVAA